MLDRMKAPKKIDASAAAEPPVERKGSAWNSGGTWEEKDVSGWAKDALRSRLGALSASSGAAGSGMEGMLQQINSLDFSKPRGSDDVDEMVKKMAAGYLPLRARVTEVKSLEGSAAVVSTRGQTRHPYEFGFELEWEATQEEGAPADGAAEPSKPAKECSGTLTYADVAPAAAWEVSHKWKKASAQTTRDQAALDALKAEVENAVAAFAKELEAR